jgi:hypothetical protein
MKTRLETTTYLDDMQQYVPIIEAIIGMRIERPEPRQLKITDGVASCTIQFPAYITDESLVRPTIQQAADTVKAKTLKLQEQQEN